MKIKFPIRGLIFGALLLGGSGTSPSTAAEVHLQLQGTSTFLRVESRAGDDWRMQSSSDVQTWSNVTAFGTILGGHTNAPWRIVWADENGMATAGLHVTFKLAASGEDIFLTDTDANFNAILDRVSFGAQESDRSYARTPANPDVWAIAEPGPGLPNP